MTPEQQRDKKGKKGGKEERLEAITSWSVDHRFMINNLQTTKDMEQEGMNGGKNHHAGMCGVGVRDSKRCALWVIFSFVAVSHAHKLLAHSLSCALF